MRDGILDMGASPPTRAKKLSAIESRTAAEGSQPHTFNFLYREIIRAGLSALVLKTSNPSKGVGVRVPLSLLMFTKITCLKFVNVNKYMSIRI